MVLYVVLLVSYFVVVDFAIYFIPAVVLAQVLTHLSTHWSATMKAKIAFSPVDKPEDAEVVCCVPESEQGASKVCCYPSSSMTVHYTCNHAMHCSHRHLHHSTLNLDVRCHHGRWNGWPAL